MSDILDNLIPLPQFLDMLDVPSDAQGSFLPSDHPSKTPVIHVNVSLPPKDFTPFHEEPIPVVDLNSLDRESYFYSYAKYLVGLVSERTSY